VGEARLKSFWGGSKVYLRKQSWDLGRKGKLIIAGKGTRKRAKTRRRGGKRRDKDVPLKNTIGNNQIILSIT